MLEADTIIQPAAPAAPAPAAGHPVLWFAVGLGLFTIDAMLLAAGLRLTWMLLHL